MTVETQSELKRTPLHSLHAELGAKMVEFAGYAMPVQYGAGILEEHLHTRRAASLFDVSHMGQATLKGDAPAAALEALVPGDVQALGQGRMRYTMLTNDAGGILDDLIVTNVGTYLFLVFNAGRKEADIAHLNANLAGSEVEVLDRALIALQGPQAVSVLSRFAPGVEEMTFMSAQPFTIEDSRLAIMRAGYTGEDGFEITVPANDAERIARLLLDQPEVAPAGLGARDSLRLEAGLCLYGHDIDETTTPIEAGLAWTIGKRRREEGGFPGAGVILGQLRGGPARRRVGLRPDGKAPAREHTVVTDTDGNQVGEVTSGGFGPSFGGPVSMGYVRADCAAEGTPLHLVVRGTPRPATVAALPFVPHRYHRG